MQDELIILESMAACEGFLSKLKERHNKKKEAKRAAKAAEEAPYIEKFKHDAPKIKSAMTSIINKVKSNPKFKGINFYPNDVEDDSENGYMYFQPLDHAHYDSRSELHDTWCSAYDEIVKLTEEYFEKNSSKFESELDVSAGTYSECVIYINYLK